MVVPCETRYFVLDTILILFFVNKNLVLGKVIRCSDNLCSLSDDYNVEVMI